MAKTVNTTIKFTGQFDTSQITKGLQEIKKQITSSNISEELKKQLQDSFNKVEINLPKLDKFMKKEDFNLKELDEYQKLVQEITKDMTNFSKIANEADFTKNFSEQDTARLKKFDEQIKQVDNRLKTTKEEIIKTFSSSDKGKIGGKSNNTLNGFIEQLISVPPDKIEEKLDEVIKDAETQADQAVDKLQTIFKNKATGHKGGKGFIELLFGENSGVSLKQGKTLGGSTKGDQGAYSAFNVIREQVLKLEKDAGPDKINPILEAYSKFIEEFFNVPKDKHSVLDGLVTPEIVERLKEFKGPDGIEGLKQALGNGNLKILAEGEAEKIRLTQEQAAELKKIVDDLATKGEITKNQANNLIKSLTGLSGVINDNTNAAKNLDNQQKALSATFGSLANRITNSISALTIFNRSIQIVRQAVNSVRELDAAFTQIAIVSEQSNEQAWQMFESFNKLAKQYSITTKDLTEGAKLFYQQGLNAADTMKMVEASTISAALGEVTMTEAANTLTAAIQGYNESASVAMDYTDKIAMVGAVSAADFNELSAAMEKTASSAYTAGIDFDHLLGYLGKMIEVTREAPANLGTAMKTIIARFEDMKKDPTALIDGASANKVESALATIGIALRDTAGEFRPLQDVITELGMKWESLTRNQQAYIATVAAGSRQQSRFLAMMNNFDRTLELITESQNSAGAAAEQYATYQDSAAAASARLTAAWEEFYKKIVSPETITNTINLLTKLVETMSKIGPVASVIGASIGALGLQTISKTVIPNITKGIVEASKAGNGANAALKIAASNTGEVAANLIVIGAEITLIIAALALLTTAIVLIIKHQRELNDLRDNPYKQYLNKLSEENKIRKEMIKNLKEENNSIKDNLDIYEKYENQVVLTEDELKEQNEAVDKLKESNQDIIVITNELGKKIINNTELLKEQNEANKDKIKILEKEAALAKLTAITPTETSQQMYSKNTNTYMKDWTVENLQNFGFSEEEAKKLNEYGEFFRNESNLKGTMNFAFSNLPTSSLSEKILQKFNDRTGRKRFNQVQTITDFGVEGVKYFKDLQSNDVNIITKDLEEIDKIYQEVSPDVQKFFDIIKEEGQLAINVINMMKEASKEYAKTLMDIELESSSMSKSTQADFSNLLNNLNVFNNGEYLKQFEGLSPEQINDRTNEIFNSIEKAMVSVNDVSFHELTKQLLDPSLSPNERQKIVDDFKFEFGDVYGRIDKELEQMLDQFVAGSTADIKKREALSKILGISTEDLKDFNYSQIAMIDKFQVMAKKGNKNFDVGKWILTDVNSKQLLNALDNLEQDILKDPTVYRKSQKIMIDFFENDMGLDKKTAYDTFESIFGNIPEAAASAAYDTFQNAQNLVLTEPDKALTKKQSEAYKELEALLGENLRYYISINEQGEEYLSIAGRIAVFDKASEKYRNSLIAQGQDWIIQLEEIKATNNKISDEQAKQIKNLERDIKLNDEKIRKLDEIRKYNAQITAETANIDRADIYQNNLSDIKKAEDEMEKFNGRMNSDTAKSIIQMNSEYIQYLDKKLVGEDYYYTITAENIELLKKKERERYNEWIEEQKGRLQSHIDSLESELAYYTAVVEAEGDLSKVVSEQSWEDHEEATDKILKDAEDTLGERAEGEENTNQEILNGALDTADKFEQTWSDAYDSLGDKWDALAEAMEAGEPRNGAQKKIAKSDWKPKKQTAEKIEKAKLEKPKDDQNGSDDLIPEEFDENAQHKRRAEEQITRIRAALERLQAARDSLVPLGPELEDTSKGSEKADESMKKLTKTLEDLADALEDLDKLLKDVKRDLKDITIDYNPFTDLFEAWEAEWDYYYNIKNLIKQLETQSTYIDNIISADYTSAREKLDAYDAKVGNITGKIAANDAYITTLRAGIAKQAKELESEFNQYYNVDNRMGGWQIFQRDTTLGDWEKTINEVKRYSYELSKLINTQENELNLLEANQEALEQERSAYESILSTVDSLIDSLGNNEDITVDLSDLEGIKVELQAAIDNESVENIKEQIRDLNDYIQELNIKLDLNDNVVEKGLEEGYERLKDEIDDLQDLIDTLNEKIAEQQELLQQLSEIYNMYVDTAIDTQQELYDAIVEQYQDEINEKKKHYDYLKQLDNDYLKAVKDNIDKERKAREDANKQQDFQKNLQRAQLLQQDTSGAYRNELANLNKEIENQRQDLYDDLVDKQVEALEKEIEKRHELYDLEVSAMEERLAYMQENAILLWEMVNNIVAGGANEMMATLENTTNYINQNELAKERQRRQWELNTQATYKGVIEGEIDMLQRRIDRAKEELDAYEELQDAIELSTATYSESQAILQQENAEFQQVMNEFMQVWTTMTSDLTGYNESWAVTLSNIRIAMEKDIQALDAMGDEGGSIFLLNEKLKQLANEMYDDFLRERESYRDSLNSMINEIEARITAAIDRAANAIQDKANNISFNNVTPKDNGGAGITPTSSINPTDSGAGGPTKEPAKKYKIQVEFSGQKTTGGKVTIHKLLDGFTSPEEAIAAAEAYIEKMAKQLKLMSWGKGQLNPVAYKQGGFADFTGPAWLDGTKSNPERILSPRQTKLFESMVSSLERTAANNSNINSALGSSYNIGDINTNINVEKLDNETDIDRVARQVENRIMKSIRNRVVVSVA